MLVVCIACCVFMLYLVSVLALVVFDLVGLVWVLDLFCCFALSVCYRLFLGCAFG